MAGESTSTLIIFIGAMLAASAVAMTLLGVVGGISAPVESASDRLAGDLETDITIISDAGSDAVYNEEEEQVTLLVKNTGSSDLIADTTQNDVLINGEFITPESIQVVSHENERDWRPGSVVEITVNVQLDDGVHRATVYNGQSKSEFQFRV